MAHSSTRGSGRCWSLAIAVLAAVGGLVALRPIWDVDIFWHISAGRWILEHRAFPTVDIFTFVEPPRGWITFQWLYEVICAQLDSMGGLTAVRIMHGLATSAAFVAFATFTLRYLRRAGRVDHIIIPLAIFLLALLFALYADRVRARPHVFNLLFWSLALDVLLIRGAQPRLQAVLLTAIVFLWSNLHAGGSFIFLVVLAAWPLSAWAVDRWNGHEGRWMVAPGGLKRGMQLWGLAVAAALVSPNWLAGVRQAYTMLDGSEALIEEWLPFWHYFSIASNPLHILAGLVPILGLAAVILAVRRGKAMRLDVVLAALGLALLPFRSARFVYFLALTAVLLAPPLMELVPSLVRRWKVPVFVGGALLLGVTTIDYHSRVQFGSMANYFASFSHDIDERRFPVEFNEVLRDLAHDRDEPMKVFCQPNWGGYLLYHHYPAVRVMVDGRGNISEELGTRLHFIYLHRHDPRYAQTTEKIYDESGADVLIVQRPVAPKGHSLSNWRAVAESPKGSVLIRR